MVQVNESYRAFAIKKHAKNKFNMPPNFILTN